MTIFWAACQNYNTGPVLPITDPNNAAVIAMYNMDLISGSTLADNSPNGNDGTIVGAVSGSDVNGDYLDFTGGTSNRVDMPTGMLAGLAAFNISFLVLADAINGSLFSYGWGVNDPGNIIILNEPSSARSRAIMRDSTGVGSSSATGDQYPATFSTVYIDYDGTNLQLGINGSVWNVSNPSVTLVSSFCKLGNRETDASAFSGNIYKAAWYNRSLTESEKQEWRDLS